MALLRVLDLSKSFFGVPVLEGVDFELEAGEVLGLVGENGAGKSTVMKIVGGVHLPDSGSIELDGTTLRLGRPLDAERAGIATVYQEFNLLADATVAENIFLGREPSRLGVVNRRAMERGAEQVLAEIGVVGISPRDRVSELSVAQQQMVEIAKAVSINARVIQMDEPTSALADHEVELLFSVIQRLKTRGVGIIYVSHRLREVFSLCDRVVILKDGVLVAAMVTAELTEDEVVRLMVGRPIATYFPDRVSELAERTPVLTLAHVGNDWVNDITLEVRAGEILGIAGLQGSGRTELLAGIFGSIPFTRGTVTAPGGEVRASSPLEAIGRGIAMIPEDRKREGLQMEQSIRDNALAVIRAVFPKRMGESGERALEILGRLEVVARSDMQDVKFLSGGNQQKVVIAKWLLAEPKVLLLDEPTRGIDVGAKVAIYRLMRDLADAGFAVVMVSSELLEVIGMADRIAVMRDGTLAAILPPGSSEVEILAAAMGSGAAA
ncbi:MAG: sugar ABC transporter ATP-binding protein [Actinobacteria bacterium]|nr:sugar ABC transporter ATP-binding protein [Actinomycetota bacterium]